MAVEITKQMREWRDLARMANPRSFEFGVPMPATGPVYTI